MLALNYNAWPILLSLFRHRMNRKRMGRGVAGVVILLGGLVGGMSRSPAEEPAVDWVARHRQAQQWLQQGQPARAILILEPLVSRAQNQPEVLACLRDAYASELAALEQAQAPESTLQELRKKRDQLPPAAAKSPIAGPAEPQEALREAIQRYQAGRENPSRFREAAAFFAAAFRKVEMTPEQTAAWVYCRLRVAHDQLQKSTDPATAQQILQEIEAARQLAPGHYPKLDALALQIREQAQARLQPVTTNPKLLPADAANVRSANFRWVGPNEGLPVAQLLEQAESIRTAIWQRWQQPANRRWDVPCDLQLVRASAREARAVAELAEGQIARRSLPIIPQEAAQLGDHFRRELVHLLLVDLFPEKAPPTWIAMGWAGIEQSSQAQRQGLDELAEQVGTKSWIPLAEVLQSPGSIPPGNREKWLYLESQSLVQFFVTWRGEATFLAFVRDLERLGFERAAERHYAIRDLTSLEQFWIRAIQNR